MAKADLVTCSFWFCSPLLLFLEDSCKGLDKWMNLVIWSLVIYMKMFGHRHCLESMYEILIESIIHGDCKAARLRELMWSWSGSKQLKHAVGCSLWRGSFAEHLHICTFAHLHALCPHSIFVVSQRVGLHAFVLQVWYPWSHEVMLPAYAHHGTRCMDVHGAPKHMAWLCEHVFRTVDLGSRIQVRPRAGESSCNRFHHAERRGAMVGHGRLAKNRGFPTWKSEQEIQRLDQS